MAKKNATKVFGVELPPEKIKYVRGTQSVVMRAARAIEARVMRLPEGFDRMALRVVIWEEMSAVGAASRVAHALASKSAFPDEAELEPSPVA